ncbi:MAG TPA: zinc ABC transporter substrate-binding protein, partial [Pirellulaceae bacterium]
HVWMDVGLWTGALHAVEAILSEYDPDHAQDYRVAAAEFEMELNSLDAYGRTAVASIPSDRRVLVTSHDAFHYFGRAYGLEVLSVQGITTESEAGLRRVNELVRDIADRKIAAVFVESSVSRKSLEAVVEGVQARGGSVEIGGELYSDAMGPVGSYEGTYLGMLDHNITVVTRALGGQAPPTGRLGKLTVPSSR